MQGMYGCRQADTDPDQGNDMEAQVNDALIFMERSFDYRSMMFDLNLGKIAGQKSAESSERTSEATGSC
nr:hypothetical protein Itr_chr12CG08970 [Ipomoea trifida]